MLLDDLLIDRFKPDALIVVTAVSSLAQLAVAAQVGVGRFAAHDKQAWQ